MDHPLQAYEEDDRISTWLNSLDVSTLHDGEGGGEYSYTEPALRADSPLEGWLSPSNTDTIKPTTMSPNALLNPSPDLLLGTVPSRTALGHAHTHGTCTRAEGLRIRLGCAQS